MRDTLKTVETVDMLQAILSSIDEGIHVVNKEGVTIYYNHVIAQLDGLAEEQVIGKHVFDVFPSLDMASSTLMKVLRTGESIVHQPQSYTTVTGKQVDTVNTTIPIRVNGQIVGAVEVAKDVSKVKHLSEKLVELQAKINAQHSKEKSLPKNKKDYFTVEDFITQDEQMIKMKGKVPKIAMTNSPVLVFGETGTGKEIIVQSIHSSSVRKKEPFIAQNCAALPSSLLESLLFGTTKGSFTGSVDRQGLFELADGGTLFLDEINSMPIELQSKLLRVLQEGKIRRIGGKKTYDVDVKIIVAMNENPRQAVEEKRLRSDLYYRIQVVSLYISPLRERRNDIPLLIRHFINKYNKRFQQNVQQIADDVLAKMVTYEWPGNVRELEHAIEGAMNMVDGEVLKIEHFPDYLQHMWSEVTHKTSTVSSASHSLSATTLTNIVQSNNESGQIQELVSLKEHLEKEEQKWIKQAIDQTKGNVKQAAKALKIPRQTLQYKLKKYGIESQ